MSETSRVPVDCPACGDETVHELLNAGGHATVRCTACDHTHKTELTEPETETVNVIVSQDGESWPTATEVEPDHEFAVGDEFVAETSEAIQQVRVTDVEIEKGRAESATAEAAVTVWTRAVDNVGVDVTIHPNDGRHRENRSEKIYVPGDKEFEVGETERFGEEEIEVVGIHVRDDTDGYSFDKADIGGQSVFAKDIKRLFGRDQITSAWSGW